jgi:hypothetical protein
MSRRGTGQADYDNQGNVTWQDGTVNQAIANYVDGVFMATEPVTDTVTQSKPSRASMSWAG